MCLTRDTFDYSDWHPEGGWGGGTSKSVLDRAPKEAHLDILGPETSFQNYAPPFPAHSSEN